MDRFWSKVEPTGFCWNWAAHKSRDGYGRFSLDGRPVEAHRVAYELLIGPIPDGLVIDHLCRNRRCVNPDHLEPVTNAENIRRGAVAHAARAKQMAKTHCPKGHPYSGGNLRIHPNGGRACRACARAAEARYRASKK